jgi:hypothetical protein
MYAYPIWHEVNACIYQGSKSYGGRDTCETTVKVGTSKSNSEVLVRHVTTRRTDGEYTVFRFLLDIGHGAKTRKTLWMHTKTKTWFKRKPKGGSNGATSNH